VSGFRVKIVLAFIQTDLLRRGASILVIEPDDADNAGSASFPGIEAKRQRRAAAAQIVQPHIRLPRLERDRGVSLQARYPPLGRFRPSALGWPQRSYLDALGAAAGRPAHPRAVKSAINC
jgi:hypothetical protein